MKNGRQHNRKEKSWKTCMSYDFGLKFLPQLKINKKIYEYINGIQFSFYRSILR